MYWIILLDGSPSFVCKNIKYKRHTYELNAYRFPFCSFKFRQFYWINKKQDKLAKYKTKR